MGLPFQKVCDIVQKKLRVQSTPRHTSMRNRSAPSGRKFLMLPDFVVERPLPAAPRNGVKFSLTRRRESAKWEKASLLRVFVFDSD
ncbi:MAG: hypothetical protein SF339_05815, partial [Blastocatellia bacterium]|nr:hypothetical protein [Blastocatellia bacterium]